MVGLVDGGESRRDGRGGGDVVEARDRQLRGDGDAALGGGVEDADGKQVGEREDRGRALGAVEQLGAGDPADVAAVADRARDGDRVPLDADGLDRGAPAGE
jgi:hypothetical protein